MNLAAVAAEPGLIDRLPARVALLLHAQADAIAQLLLTRAVMSLAPAEPANGRVLSTKAAAAKLGISADTLRRQSKPGGPLAGLRVENGTKKGGFSEPRIEDHLRQGPQAGASGEGMAVPDLGQRGAEARASVLSRPRGRAPRRTSLLRRGTV